MGNREDWTLLDQIHGLHLALRVIEQRKQNIEPDQYKSVIGGMANLFLCAVQQNYAKLFAYLRHFKKHVAKSVLVQRNY